MLSPEENFKPLSNEALEIVYMSEIRAFDTLTKLPEFPSILQHSLNYQDFLLSRKSMFNPMEMILGASKGTRVVEVSGMSPAIRELFCTAHFAACSILLEGFSFYTDRLRSKPLIPGMRQFIVSPYATRPENAKVIMERLHGIDAVRTIQLLRAFGLITRQSGEIYQLGLGAAGGSKDIDYVHTEPVILTELDAGGDKIKFSSIRKRVADIVINDLDPRYQTLYEHFSRDPSSNVTGYVGDTLYFLEELARSDIHKRNLVTMLRIEPAMIPDSYEILSRLCPVLDDSCDFVLSIGAGDSPVAYKQRIDVISDMFATLDEVGLEPVLFKLHLGGTVMQQASSLQFGHAAVSCYEILYCRLGGEVLRKVFGK